MDRHIPPAFLVFLGRLGQNSPTRPETEEMYRRCFFAGWRASAQVSRWEHLKRAVAWRPDHDHD
jgi:hypothetical protein